MNASEPTAEANHAHLVATLCIALLTPLFGLIILVDVVTVIARHQGDIRVGDRLEKPRGGRTYRHPAARIKWK